MLNLVVIFTFEDDQDCKHTMTLSFFGKNYHEAYESALAFANNECRMNEWCLSDAKVMTLLDTRS